MSIGQRIPDYKISPMDDGQMGSIRFITTTPSDERCFGGAVAEAEYLDADGIRVNIAVNVDDAGDLYEIDFWKVDFSPLVRYPEPSDLKNIRLVGAATTEQPWRKL